MTGASLDQIKSVTGYLIKAGLSFESLIEISGSEVAKIVFEDIKNKNDRRISVLVGPGNKGATALVAARRLLTWGIESTVLLACPRTALHKLTSIYADLFETLNGSIYEPGAPLPPTDIWLDGLVGTGLKSKPFEGAFRDLVDAANHDSAPTISIDLPSGINPETGRALILSIKADITVAIGQPTIGVIKGTVAPMIGKLLVADIGIPPSLWRKVGVGTPVSFRGEGWMEWNVI